MRPAAPVLFLDAMGTLLRLHAPAPALARELARRGVTVTEAQAGRALAAEIAYYRAHLQEGATPEALSALRLRCAAVLRAALPASAELARVSETEVTDALIAALRFEAYPDAAPALRAAGARGQRAFVVSNWDCSLGEVLAGVGLRDLVAGVVTSAQAGVAKPSPGIFARALTLAGCEPGEVLHVGDSEAEDVAGARAAGIAVRLLVRDGRPPPGVPSIASLDELARP